MTTLENNIGLGYRAVGYFAHSLRHPAPSLVYQIVYSCVSLFLPDLPFERKSQLRMTYKQSWTTK